MGRLFSIDVEGLPAPFEVRADPDEDDLIDLRKRRLLKAWRRRRFALGRIPFRHELDQELLAELAPYLMELELQSGGDFRYAAYGAAIAAAYGSDMTGRRTSEFPTPIARAFLSVYGLALKTKIPYATRHKPPPPVRIGHWHRLVLPIRTEHKDVGGFLVCNVPVNR
ncbi:MAG: hypothetical protein NBV67_05810 [Tagaea sp.]|nr:hypothetical protein [Tagaea sp.]